MCLPSKTKVLGVISKTGKTKTKVHALPTNKYKSIIMENHKCSNSGAIKNNATQKENEHATVRTDELTQNTDETSALGGGHLCNNDLCL